ncbi:hypothetical protein HF526_33210, partial [Pseudonocardia sp. K10HN5]|nr:hypothetical protein [Pseudonocardia acidicola]
MAPLPRACIDAARRLRDGREITELMADAIQRGFCSAAERDAQRPQDHAYTTERAARLSAAGAVVLPTLPGRLNRDESGGVSELRRAYTCAARRPR